MPNCMKCGEAEPEKVDERFNQIDGRIEVFKCPNCGEVVEGPKNPAPDPNAWENRGPAGMCSNGEYKEQMEKLRRKAGE